MFGLHVPAMLLTFGPGFLHLHFRRHYSLRQGIIIIDTGRGGLRSLPIPAAGRTFDGESIPALSAARLFLSSYMQN